mmetsp:Transcript_1682/g.3933  ORF Transcript_1682/g.3933 Transcript_1682/m.3933 type:complete len:276 (+) Transcript_1682:272-1099(+)
MARSCCSTLLASCACETTQAICSFGTDRPRPTPLRCFFSYHRSLALKRSTLVMMSDLRRTTASRSGRLNKPLPEVSLPALLLPRRRAAALPLRRGAALPPPVRWAASFLGPPAGLAAAFPWAAASRICSPAPRRRSLFGCCPGPSSAARGPDPRPATSAGPGASEAPTPSGSTSLPPRAPDDALCSSAGPEALSVVLPASTPSGSGPSRSAPGSPPSGASPPPPPASVGLSDALPSLGRPSSPSTRRLARLPSHVLMVECAFIGGGGAGVGTKPV